MSEKTETSAAAAAETVPENPFEGFVTESSHDDGTEGVAPVQEQAATKEAEKAEIAPDKEQAEGEKKAGKKNVDDRIAEITAKRRQAERDADASAKRVAELEARLAALESGKKTDRDQLTQGGEAAKSDPSAPPDPTDENLFPYGEVDPRYVAALARHEAKQALAEDRRKTDEARQADAAAREAQETQQKLDNHIRKGVERHDDFEAALEALEAIETPIAAESAKLLLESEYGADLLYHFGKNPVEAAEIAAKSPFEQARYIGKLEARFAAERAAPQDEKKNDAKVSKAPPPPDLRARGSNGRYEVPDDTTDFAAFEAKYKSK